ncbi:MAG: hypothetical protein IJJ57_00375, partial [Ruminococcus sp.]|nr:hypothetical protein [Ruminococcus sp.]
LDKMKSILFLFVALHIIIYHHPFSGFQRQSLWQGVGQSPTNEERSAKGEFQNSPVDCFERGNALQERAFPGKSILF